MDESNRGLATQLAHLASLFATAFAVPSANQRDGLAPAGGVPAEQHPPAGQREPAGPGSGAAVRAPTSVPGGQQQPAFVGPPHQAPGPSNTFIQVQPDVYAPPPVYPPLVSSGHSIPHMYAGTTPAPYPAHGNMPWLRNVAAFGQNAGPNMPQHQPPASVPHGGGPTPAAGLAGNVPGNGLRAADCLPNYLHDFIQLPASERKFPLDVANISAVDSYLAHPLDVDHPPDLRVHLATLELQYCFSESDEIPFAFPSQRRRLPGVFEIHTAQAARMLEKAKGDGGGGRTIWKRDHFMYSRWANMASQLQLAILEMRHNISLLHIANQHSPTFGSFEAQWGLDYLSEFLLSLYGQAVTQAQLLEIRSEDINRANDMQQRIFNPHSSGLIGPLRKAMDDMHKEENAAVAKENAKRGAARRTQYGVNNKGGGAASSSSSGNNNGRQSGTTAPRHNGGKGGRP